MSDVFQIIIGILVLVGVFIASRFGMAWRIRRACVYIIRDMERRRAFDHASAVALPYSKTDHFKIGLKDFRPKALQGLVEGGIIGVTPEGRFFLKQRLEDLKL